MASQLDKIRKNMDAGKITIPKDPHQRTAGGFDESIINPELSETVPGKLEDIEVQINKLKSRMWESAWLIGTRLVAIRDHHLKSLGFLSITEYARDKFDLSSDLTSRFIFISSYFAIADARQFGSKLRLLSGLEKSEHQNYLLWMKENNPTYREIEEKIKQGKIQKPGRPKQDISLTQATLTVDFKKMGVSIHKDKTKSFLEKLNELIIEFSE